jgi:hypothetical protein
MRPFLCLLLATACRTPAPPPVGPEPAMTSETCLQRIELDRDGGVLAEQRSLGRPWFDFAGGFPRGEVHEGTFRAAQATAAFTWLDRPVLWFAPDREQVVLRSDAFLTDFSAIDATSLAPTGAEGVVLGKAAPDFVAALGPQRFAEFLMRSELIRIYAHIGGWVCLQAESQGAEGWVGEYRGEHTYFTNDEQHGSIAFSVRIAADGTITVRGR